MSGFSYAMVIGKSPGLFRAHIDGVLRNAAAGLTRDMWDFHAIIFRNKRIAPAITDELVSIALLNDIKVTFYDEWHGNFLENLYACWNLTQEVGDRPYTIRAGSDQFFSPGSFANMYEAHIGFGSELVTQMQTVESILSPQSRHFIRDFGTSYDTFKEEEFNLFAKEISRPGLYTIEEAKEIWGKPTNFTNSWSNNHARTDGVSWCMSKKLWQKFGPMEPINRQGITGDVSLHDKIELAGIPNRLVGDAISFHLVRGESR